MLVSYKWLGSYVDVSDITPEDLAEKITRSGIEVDQVERKGEGLKKIVVGHVLSCEKHPNADRLSLCRVDIGEDEPVQIVCGAPNVAAGQKVIVAKPGARIAGNIKIKKGKIRGEQSNGMICSLQELGYDSKVVPKEYADGIFVLPEDAEPGSDALELLNMDDVVLELDLTPNRGDCLSMIGVAYETAAILDKDVRLPEIRLNERNEKASDYITVKVETPEDAPLYAAKVIKNVKIGPSPLWLQTRLMNAGIRPHNNVVDITNYILLEYGQPLHAFDYDCLGSKEILVRRAKDGETITTLDDVERKLNPDHLVITNGKEPVALAGVMGGANSEVTDDTTTVLLEAAYFDPKVIRKASLDHGLRSEASNRFEKGIDPARVREAAERACMLIAELAGGEVLEGTVEDDALDVKPVKVSVELPEVNKFLGTNIPAETVENIFRRLRFKYERDGANFHVEISSRRPDISIKEDLYEEIARLYGYDLIPETLPEGPRTAGTLTPYQKKRRVVRNVLEGAGMNQAMTYSLTNEKKFGQFALNRSEPIKLAMPMSEEHSILRNSLLPHLLDAVRYNIARKNDHIALYETGTVFISRGEDVLPEEREHLAGAITGLYVNHPWQGEKLLADFYIVKGILEALFEKLQLDSKISYEKAEVDGMHPGQTAHILLDGEVIGFLGKVHPEKEKEYDVKNVFVFELDMERLLKAETAPLQYEAIPKFPSISRDIALIVDKEQSAGELAALIKEAGGRLLKDVKVFDLYEGENIAAGKKSVAFTLTYLDPEKTLTDEEVTEIHEKILSVLHEKAGAELRK